MSLGENSFLSQVTTINLRLSARCTRYLYVVWQALDRNSRSDFKNFELLHNTFGTTMSRLVNWIPLESLAHMLTWRKSHKKSICLCFRGSSLIQCESFTNYNPNSRNLPWNFAAQTANQLSLFSPIHTFHFFKNRINKKWLFKRNINEYLMAMSNKVKHTDTRPTTEGSVWTCWRDEVVRSNWFRLTAIVRLEPFSRVRRLHFLICVTFVRIRRRRSSSSSIRRFGFACDRSFTICEHTRLIVACVSSIGSRLARHASESRRAT